MSWTDPRTWTAGETFPATTLNTHLRDNMDFLSSRPHLVLSKSTSALSLSTDTWTDIPWTSVDRTSDASLYDSDSDTIITIPNGQAGRWLIMVTARFAAPSSGRRGLRISCGTTNTEFVYKVATDGSTYVNGLFTYGFAADDQFTIQAVNTAGTARNLNECQMLMLFKGVST